MQKIKSPVQFSIILLSLTAIIAIFSNCSKTATSVTIVGDWAYDGDVDPVARTQAASFQIGDSVYMCGGFNGTTRLNDLWVFNWQGNTWSKRAPFPGTARSNAVGFAVSGKGYIATGFDGVNMLGDCWQYNPATNSWKQVADFANNSLGSTARYGAVGFNLGNTGYVGTGYDGNYNRDMYAYNPATNTWSQAPSIGGSKRQNAAVFVYNDTVAYIVSGVNNGTYPNDMWKYNPTLNPGFWTQLRPITNVNTSDTYDALYGSNILRSDATALVIGNKGYLALGNHNGIINTCWEYTFDNLKGGTADTWVQKTNFEGTARQNAIGFTIHPNGTNPQAYICTGGNGTGYSVYDDIWNWYPNNVVNPNNNN